jgi:hypothetical protein
MPAAVVAGELEAAEDTPAAPGATALEAAGLKIVEPGTAAFGAADASEGEGAVDARRAPSSFGGSAPPEGAEPEGTLAERIRMVTPTPITNAPAARARTRLPRLPR